jgi:4-diphosphocytidyl-2-C-methyl-D-erythritol kinase
MAVPDINRQSTIAPAKLNLSLRILDTRPDGYHDLESVIVKVTLYDGIDVHRGGESLITVTCNEPSVPIDAHNLVCRAAQALRLHAAASEPLSFHLHKRIPSGAGLGGGSSDAAATLQLLNSRWQLGLSTADLQRIAATIGSDVPLFLEPATAVFMEGRGEITSAVHLPWNGWFVLVSPALHVSTARVYSAWRSDGPRSTASVRGCLAPEIQTAEALDDTLFNDLTPCVFEVESRLAQLHARLETLTHRRFHLTGSGSTLFSCCDTHEDAVILNREVAGIGDLRHQIVRLLRPSDDK